MYIQYNRDLSVQYINELKKIINCSTTVGTSPVSPKQVGRLPKFLLIVDREHKLRAVMVKGGRSWLGRRAVMVKGGRTLFTEKIRAKAPVFMTSFCRP